MSPSDDDGVGPGGGVVGDHMSGPAPIEIGGRAVGPGRPTFVIAELSANHGQRLDRALELVRLAAEAGADAVKLQTYTPATMTLDLDLPAFRVGEGTLWAGRRLADLYAEAMTPWEWYPDLAAAAAEAGLVLFSTPFDATAVDFLAELDTPAYKIASFELLDLPLIRRAAAHGRPLIMSTGMATQDEIGAAIAAATEAGAGGLVLLRCNSSYPAPSDEMDLRTIPDMIDRWSVPVGLSDHTLGLTAVTAAIALGACAVEKHLTLDRGEGGPDAAFSLQPEELAATVQAIRDVEAALGTVRYGPSPSERPSLSFRRSVWVTQDLAAGDAFSADNLAALRPAGGLAPDELDQVVGRRAARAIAAGTALTWNLVE
jgi:pseudaminic acid synthase